MRRTVLLGFVLLVFAGGASAQHLGELSANYSYLHYEPLDNAPSVNLNGGGGAAVLYFAGFFGLKAEFQAYAGQNLNFSYPPGSVRCPLGCAGTAHANLYNANFGPVIKIRIKRLQPFFEAMAGAARTNFYTEVNKNCVGCVTSRTPDNWAANVVVGGGLDIKVTRHLAVRPVEVNYFLTRFVNVYTSGYNNQNNFRYQAGLVFEF
jgi:hypothetical protein